jgi:DNA primase
MAGIIPQSFIDDLLTRIDIVELIDGFVPLKKTGNAYTCCCPFHQEKTPSFNVIAHKQFYYCFGCGASGNAIKFIMQFSQLEFPEAIHFLAHSLGLTVPESQNQNQQIALSSQQGLLEQIQKVYQKNLFQKPPELIAYLKQRGLNQEMIQLFQLGYAPDDWRFLVHQLPKQHKFLEETGMIIAKDNKQYYDRFRQRLMFPLHNRKGKLIGFAGRVISPDQKPKYMNSPETQLFHKQKELYGLYQVIQHQPQPAFIVVVEGYLDVISLFQFAIPNAVATMGTATSNFHLQTLNKYTNDIVFCFDGDSAGQQAAWRALENCLPLYNQLSSIRFLILPEEHDPDSFIRQYGKEAFLQAIKLAIPLHSYFSRQLHLQFSKQGTQKLLQEAKKLIHHLEEGPGKEMLVEELTRITRIDPYRLRQLLSQTHEKTVTEIPNPSNPKQNSPLRMACALLIQNPKLYQHIPENLKNYTYAEPLNALLTYLNEDSELTSTNLVERFRNSHYFEALNKLAIMAHKIKDAQQLATLNETLQFICRQQTNEQIDGLLKKSKEQGLSLEEKQHLQELLQTKQQKSTI